MWSRSELGPTLAGTVLPFVLILYLALEGGGYDSVVRSEVGIVAWWLVLVGALAGLLPAARLGRTEWIALGGLAAFAGWTAIGIGWSDSSERSVQELARVLTYLGVLTLALSAQGSEGPARAVRSVGAAIALIGGLALLSRLHPGWFPENDAASLLPTARERLAYPLNYWNGLAALMAIGVPLVLTVAIESRRLVTQALAAAAIPAMALTAFYTLSRGGAGELAVALVALLALLPRRLAAVPTIALAALGSGFLIWAATRRDALEDGLANALARDQGDEMLLLSLGICAAVAVARIALAVGAQRGLGPRPAPSRRQSLAGLTVAVVAATAIALAAGLPGEIEDGWREFKDPETTGSDSSRFASARGNGRYQFWESATDANSTDPLIGIGPGTFEYWWASDGTLPTYVRDAHSLYLETLGELGVIGLTLLLALVLGMIGLGVTRTLGADAARRPWAAAATAGLVAFAVAAGIDWAWELTVLPVAALLLGAALLRPADRTPAAAGAGFRDRLILIAAALVALVVLTPVLLAGKELRASQDEVRGGDLPSALGSAQQAQDLQPYAATPRLQRALVLELQGELSAAAEAAREATNRESRNWRTWLVLSRIEAYRGNAQEAVVAYRQARALNPRSFLFEGEP